MPKTVDYPNLRFPPETIRQAAQLVDEAAGADKRDKRVMAMSVRLPDAEWELDSEDEFYAEYQASGGSARYSLTYLGQQTPGLLVIVDESRTWVNIRGPDRGTVERVAAVFDGARTSLARSGRPAANRPPIIREKTATREFYGVQVSESDLARLAAIAQKAVAPHGGAVSLEIETGDGEEVVSTKDLDFLTSKDLPSTVSRVTLRFRASLSPVRFEMEFPATPRKPAMLRVEGTDPQSVSGLFRELERAVQELTLPGAWLRRRLDSYLSVILLLIVLSPPRMPDSTSSRRFSLRCGLRCTQHQTRSRPSS